MATAKNFRAGDLVWGKMRNFPPWPARVLNPPQHNKIHVYFFGTHDHAFLPQECVTPHSRNMLAACKSKKKMSLSLRGAVTELEQSTGSSRSSDKSLEKQKRHAMLQRVSTLNASLKVQLKLKQRQQLEKRKSQLKTKVPRKKDSVPRASRPTPLGLPYNLRSIVVPEPEPKPVVEVLVPPCRACNDSKRIGATDKKVVTPCCTQFFHMSCLMSPNRTTNRPLCLGCRCNLNIALNIKMTERYKISFSYEFCDPMDERRWKGRLGVYY